MSRNMAWTEPIFCWTPYECLLRLEKKIWFIRLKPTNKMMFRIRVINYFVGISMRWQLSIRFPSICMYLATNTNVLFYYWYQRFGVTYVIRTNNQSEIFSAILYSSEDPVAFNSAAPVKFSFSEFWFVDFNDCPGAAELSLFFVF